MKVRGVRRWAVVAVGLALLCGLPVIASALPVSVPALTASQRRRPGGGSTCSPTPGFTVTTASNLAGALSNLGLALVTAGLPASARTVPATPPATTTRARTTTRSLRLRLRPPYQAIGRTPPWCAARPPASN